MTDALRLVCAGEAAMIAYLGDDITPGISAKVQALEASLRAALGDLLIDLVPSCASVLVLFDALRTDHYHVSTIVRGCAAQLVEKTHDTGTLVEIPAYYHPDSGEDLTRLAAAAGLSWEEVAQLHSDAEYRVYAIGFAPGFAYLGDVDPRIAAPRLATPRTAVPRGAVAIADRQTAIYPARSPGGWNLIGRSPQRMFDATANPPMPVRVGDRVRFIPIDRETFLRLGGEL